jgi:hypothetical protein
MLTSRIYIEHYQRTLYRENNEHRLVLKRLPNQLFAQLPQLLCISLVKRILHDRTLMIHLTVHQICTTLVSDIRAESSKQRRCRALRLILHLHRAFSDRGQIPCVIFHAYSPTSGQKIQDNHIGARLGVELYVPKFLNISSDMCLKRLVKMTPGCKLKAVTPFSFSLSATDTAKSIFAVLDWPYALFGS